jgi:hypothetical protein
VVLLVAAALVLGSAAIVVGWQQLAVKDDPLVRHPGTQPEDGVALEAPNRCLNCHGGYNPAVEPGFNWLGSMMAQSQRDFLYLSCLTVAAQDSIWAIGRPNATDICIRCHSPSGWLGGRSDPTNASMLAADDWDGISCDFCHRMYDPFFRETHAGTREGNEWTGYWDEATTDSIAAAEETFFADQAEASTVTRFDGEPFFIGDLPFSAGYTEAASGQYYVSATSDKRASFVDAAARHQMLYSRFHKSKYFCATCHDVSNPVLANLGQDGTSPLTTESESAFGYFHVERTFSEFMLSDYGLQGGADGIGPFAPGLFETSLPGNKIGKCQDCHMRDVVGSAANKKGVPTRPDDSTEHPQSGLPLHDLTGGNAWVPWVLASSVPGSPNYDATNDALLNQGPAVLTLDLTAGQGLDPAGLLAGADRARQQLELAASITGLTYDTATGALSFRVQNQSGHKLISGFPEGRRMFVNIQAYSEGSLVQEINPYDATAGTLKGLGATYVDPDGELGPPAALAAHEVYVDELVYEMHPSSELTGEDETFHFALGDGRYKDNRIPPKGFRIDEAAERISVPVWHGVEDANYFTAAEYAGGYDEVSLTIPAGADEIEVHLYYQTTSREYIEFLRDEINGTGTTLSSPTPSGEPQAYVVQTDPWFARLRAWGNTLWWLWKNNMNVDGAAPYEMAEAYWSDGGGGGGCEAPVPTLLSADGGHEQVTLSWSDEHTGDPSVTSYRVYYDQANKGQFIDDAGLATAYTDTGLTNGQQYCYKVSSVVAECESDFSNILCATPQPGATSAGVSEIETGYWSGKGKSKTWTPSGTFAPGDTVTFMVRVLDQAGSPVEGAAVTLGITGPDSTSVTSGPTDGGGWAEVKWTTTAPHKRGGGGTTPGAYAATTTGVTADGYTWDGAGKSLGFTIL